MNPGILFEHRANVKKGDFDDAMRRGYRGVVVIGSNFYEVCFFDMATARFEIETNRLFAQAGLIIIPEMSFENMNRTVNYLHDQGYFLGSLKPHHAEEYGNYKEAEL